MSYELRFGVLNPSHNVYETGGLLPSERICQDEDINFKMSVDRLVLNSGWELRAEQAKERERNIKQR